MLFVRLCLFVCLFVFLAQTASHYGVDFSVAIDDFSCFKEQGYDFAISRCWRSIDAPDSNCLDNIANAHAAGFDRVDTYMFPCFPCGNASGQMNDLVDYLEPADYGMIWLDIEDFEWSDNLTTNQNFIIELIQTGEARGQKMGVYSAHYNWNDIVGLDWCYPEQQGLPLWYAHWDNNATFSDYEPFGCWKSPLVKQIQGDATVCNIVLDRNWSPVY